ncbi:hypothetical protein [Actinomadura rugatobispora]|uniref:Uncharacterized protein n=1 Tax=Actinomadura rugatobispora TaxID=1994 RepID=A0ABW1AJ06_9ACTN
MRRRLHRSALLLRRVRVVRGAGRRRSVLVLLALLLVVRGWLRRAPLVR